MNEPIDELYETAKNQKDPFEKAHAILQLRKDYQVPLHIISHAIGIKSSYICHILRLLKCPTLIIDGYYSHAISISHLFIISRLNSEEKMIEAYEQILGNSLTVLQTEELIRTFLYQIKNEGEFISEDQKREFASSLDKNNSLKTKVIQSRSKAKLIIEVRGSLLQTSYKLLQIMEKVKSIELDKG